MIPVESGVVESRLRWAMIRCQRGRILEHEHHFNQHLPKSGEARTRWVVLMTAVMMAVEITTGILFGSMALLADGLHMASHTAALGLSVFAYIFARRRAHDSSFSFGTGKLNPLAGFASAIVLALFALLMVVESIDRFFNPVAIAYNEAIVVAVLGLTGQRYQRYYLARQVTTITTPAVRTNTITIFFAAYLHVLADALTSILAIAALLAAKHAGLPVDGPGNGRRWWIPGCQMVVGSLARYRSGAGR